MSATRFERKGWTAATLLAAEFPPPKWAVPGLIPEGLTVFAGSPKIGKSWLGLNVGLAVASGGVQFGVPVPRGDVLYLGLEDSPRRLRERIVKVLQGDPPPDRFFFEPDWPRLDQGGEAELDDWLSEHPGCRLVVVDTFSHVRKPESARSNAYQSDHDAILPLKRLADKHRVAIVAVTHTRKADADDFTDTVSGSKGLIAPADGIVTLQRQRGGGEGTLNVTGRDMEERILALRFNAEYGVWEMVGEGADWALTESHRLVVEAVRMHGPIRPSALHDLIGGNAATLRQTLRRLAQRGVLFHDGDQYAAQHEPTPLSQVSHLSQQVGEPHGCADRPVTLWDEDVSHLSPEAA